MLGTSRAQRLLLVLLAALLAAIAAVLLTAGSRQSAGAPALSRSSSPFQGPPMPAGVHAAGFSLQDEAGRWVSMRRQQGRVVVLAFIHSRCHDACPFMVEQIKGALNLLPQGSPVTTMGVSVAPAEDTPTSRRVFLQQHRMEGRLAFLNGPAADMRRVWHAYAIQPELRGVPHSTFVLLIDRRGMERVGFPADGLTPEALAHDIRVLERQPA